MKKSEKVDEQTGFSDHLTDKQIKVKKQASKHVAVWLIHCAGYSNNSCVTTESESEGREGIHQDEEG